MPEQVSIDQIPIVADGDLSEFALDIDRLHVGGVILAGCRIAGMADGTLTLERFQGGFVENVRDVALLFPATKARSSRDDDTGRLLAAVLESVKAEIGDARRVGVSEDAENAAFVLESAHA